MISKLELVTNWASVDSIDTPLSSWGSYMSGDQNFWCGAPK